MKKGIVICGFLLFSIYAMAGGDEKKKCQLEDKISAVEDLILQFSNDNEILEILKNIDLRDSVLFEEIKRQLPELMTDEELYFEMKTN